MLQNFYNTTFFHKDGSPKFVRVYYDKHFSIDPYTAIFTKTAKMLDGYNRAALCMNSLGDYYHDELPPRTYPGKPCAWEVLPQGVQKSILSEYRAIHGIAG